MSILMGASAQVSFKIGCFSYNEVLSQMTDYSAAQTSLQQLREQYAAELKSAEDEFNEKYEVFLDQQSTFNDAIKQKRMADLQALLDRNIQFRKESERLLEQAEKDLMAPLHAKLKSAINALGKSGGYLILVNTDSNAVPYFADGISEDVTTQLLEKANK